MEINIADIFYSLGESPPSIFLLHFMYIYIYIFIHFTKSKLMTGSIPVLNLPEKMYVLYPFLGKYLLLNPIYFEL